MTSNTNASGTAQEVTLTTMLSALMDLRDCPLSDADIKDLTLIRTIIDRLLVEHRFPILRRA